MSAVTGEASTILCGVVPAQTNPRSQEDTQKSSSENCLTLTSTTVRLGGMGTKSMGAILRFA